MVEREALHEFLRGRLERAARQRGRSLDGLDPDENLFEAEVIDSLGFLELVAEVESAFGVEVDFGDLDPAEFTTLDGLAKVCLEAAGQGEG
jgi:acyl carrier protein